jgi:protein-L-isoaspartate(D-aspartate) O-methyltransferase
VTSTLTDVDWQPRAAGLAAKLAADGTITDASWGDAFAQVPRHALVPRFWALDQYNAPDRLVDGADPAHREEWLDAVYSDRVLITQWAMRDGYRMASSSASLPTLVARMLHVLDVRDGHRVLEIGTGTGYNAGLLCHRVGADNVASIDIDAVLIAEAAGRLAQLGHEPLLVAGDGTAGILDRAPYDRILATCASPGVPVAWIEQLAEGGVVVTPLTVGGALAVLTKTGADEVSGHFDSLETWFMPLRPDVADPITEGLLMPIPDRRPSFGSHHGTADIDPAAFADPDFRLWLAVHQPLTVRIVDQIDGQRTRTGVIVHDETHRAEARFVDEGVVVAQDERRLFDHIETAWHAWQRYGEPGRTRIGITARTDGTQTVWLDVPDSVITWPLPV